MAAVRCATPGTSTGSGRMTDDRLEWHLLNWQLWMHSGHGVEGLPRSSVGLSSGGGQAAFDDLADASERRVAAACNAIIESLAPAPAAAIYNRYLHAVYRFPRDDQEAQFSRGRECVRVGLMAKGIW